MWFKSSTTVEIIERETVEPQQSNRERRTHLLCMCRPAIMFCGVYSPDGNAEKRDVDAAGVCADCRQVWSSSGCGVCGCRSGSICQACSRFLRVYNCTQGGDRDA